MRRLVLLILACATLLPHTTLAYAYDVLVLQSHRHPAYEETLRGFRAVHHGPMRVVVLSDYAEADISRIVREDRPSLVLAVGDSALAAARKLRQTQVVALMALGIHDRRNSPSNLAGIGMFAPAERYLELFKRMKTRRVGVVYNPAKSGWYLGQARDAAQQAGIELVVREVRNPRDTLNQLNDLKGKVDALWMLPDTTAVTRETSEAYFRFSQEERVPVVSFASAYLGLGAAAVLEIDRGELGRQAGEMAGALLRGADIADKTIPWPRRTGLNTNRNVLKNLGIDLDLPATHAPIVR
jgi:putative ABC transport system substrate-binding protein